MPDPDSQINTLRDALARLSPTERMRDFQHLMSALAPSEQISALQQSLGRAFVPGEQVQAMRDLVATFSPSADQLASLERQLEAQRAQLQAMLAQLGEMESVLQRLTDTSEQLREMQEPFLQFAAHFLPGQHEPDE